MIHGYHGPSIFQLLTLKVYNISYISIETSSLRKINQNPSINHTTVDGSEILRSPVEIGRKYPIIYDGF